MMNCVLVLFFPTEDKEEFSENQRHVIIQYSSPRAFTLRCMFHLSAQAPFQFLQMVESEVFSLIRILVHWRIQGALGAQAPLCPQDFFKIIQFSGKIREKSLF